MANAAVRELEVRPLHIPLRGRVSHAAASRGVAEPVVVAVHLNSGALGYGETLPRPYVTGENVDSVLRVCERVYGRELVDWHPKSFPEALELIDALPFRDELGQRVPAARAGVELGLLDAYSRHFRRPLTEITGWLGFSAFGPPGSADRVRHSAVLATSRISRMKQLLRAGWWYGLRDFKLKVGMAGDDERVRHAARYLAGPLRRGSASLRLDVNGAWTLEQAISTLTAWHDLPLAVVEQPLAKQDEENLSELKACVHVPLMYDESLVTLEDAERLIARQVADGFNIRLSKCGGLLPSLKLAHLARRHGVIVQLGCMVGETSILSAAGRRFLELTPDVRFVEGSFGRLLLRRDVVRKPVQFGYGGRMRRLNGLGWGIDVDRERLEALSIAGAVRLVL